MCHALNQRNQQDSSLLEYGYSHRYAALTIDRLAFVACFLWGAFSFPVVTSGRTTGIQALTKQEGATGLSLPVLGRKVWESAPSSTDSSSEVSVSEVRDRATSSCRHPR